MKQCKKHINLTIAAVQYITSNMALINSSNLNNPGVNTCPVLEKNNNQLEFNGVDMHDPHQEFTTDEWYKHGKQDQ